MIKVNASAIPVSTEISLKASVHPTEVEARVRTALLNIFPDSILELEEAKNGPAILYGKASDLEPFQTRLRDQMIRPTARNILWHCISDMGMRFYLNKQAAYIGKVNFADGDSVLGDIEVNIKSSDPEALLDSLTTGKREGEE